LKPTSWLQSYGTEWMPRDAEQTRARIFAAATVEFSGHGIAGARIDRIAARARANKQLIYAYFGSKRRLFDDVVSTELCRYVEEVPFDAERLPEYAGAAFDYFTANQAFTQLGLWHSLEPGEARHRIPAIEKAIRERTRLIAAAQRAGRIDDAIPAAELLALVATIAGTWAMAAPERSPRSGAGRSVRARRRAAVVEAVQRLTVPRGRRPAR
jgi:AcrR family transcriptional regulator